MRYSRFEEGKGTYFEMIEVLCQDPERVVEKLNSYDRKFEQAGATVQAHIHTRDIDRLFGMDNILRDVTSCTTFGVLKEVPDYSPAKDNELNFLIENELAELRSQMPDCSLLDLFREDEAAKLDTEDELRFNLIFGQKYPRCLKIDSQFENVTILLPTREGIIRKGVSNIKDHLDVDRIEDVRIN